jgi:hypothetical protein
MEPEGSLPHSQEPATCPYPEPARSSSYPHIPLPDDPSSLVPNYQSRSEASVHDSQQNQCFRWGVVSTSPNPQVGGPPLGGCPRLLVQYIRSFPPYCRPFLHPKPEDAPCRGDRDPLITEVSGSAKINRPGPWRGDRYIAPKQQQLNTNPLRVTSQKSEVLGFLSVDWAFRWFVFELL